MFLFTWCSKMYALLLHFKIMIDLSLPAIVKQIILPRAKLIHKMFEMRTITKSFSINDCHLWAIIFRLETSSCYFQYFEYSKHLPLRYSDLARVGVVNVMPLRLPDTKSDFFVPKYKLNHPIRKWRTRWKWHQFCPLLLVVSRRQKVSERRSVL